MKDIIFYKRINKTENREMLSTSFAYPRISYRTKNEVSWKMHFSKLPAIYNCKLQAVHAILI